MSDKKDKGTLTNIEIDIAKNGFELRCRYEKKATLSQKAGWIPSPYCEPEKYVAKSKADLIKQLNEVLKDCKDCSDK